MSSGYIASSISLDFSNALNCDKRPAIVDMSLAKINDTNLGMIPFYCRNGAILPPAMDLSKLKSTFHINVLKMTPNLSPSDLVPSQNWGISGIFDVVTENETQHRGLTPFGCMILHTTCQLAMALGLGSSKVGSGNWLGLT